MLLSCFTVAAFHHQAAAPELRYSSVAEGYISQAVHEIFNLEEHDKD